MVIVEVRSIEPQRIREQPAIRECIVEMLGEEAIELEDDRAGDCRLDEGLRYNLVIWSFTQGWLEIRMRILVIGIVESSETTIEIGILHRC